MAEFFKAGKQWFNLDHAVTIDEGAAPDAGQQPPCVMVHFPGVGGVRVHGEEAEALLGLVAAREVKHPKSEHAHAPKKKGH